MLSLLDLTGKSFGRWTVIREALFEGPPTGQRLQRKWLCLCECGVEREVWQTGLLGGRSQSCGCKHREIASQQATTNFTSHGKRNHPMYKIWGGMKNRCTNEKRDNYVYYGGAGVSYDLKWEKFEVFWEDMQEGWADGLTLDRIDSSLGYTKENCRWASWTTQQRNKTSNLNITYKGVTKCLAEWAQISGIKAATLRSRLVNLKWGIDAVFETPVKKRKNI